MYVAVFKPCRRRAEDEVGGALNQAVFEEQPRAAVARVDGVLVAQQAAVDKRQPVALGVQRHGLAYLRGVVFYGYVLECYAAALHPYGKRAEGAHRPARFGHAYVGMVVVGDDGLVAVFAHNLDVGEPLGHGELLFVKAALYVDYLGVVHERSAHLDGLAMNVKHVAATFDGLDFFGMDYKTATSIVQISGYFISKLIGIKVISELKKENRLKFIILSVAGAELSLVLFGALPQPFNVFALFFNGLSLGCMWGVIFSFLEGRRVTDLLASLMGLSIAISSGTAKSIGLFVMDNLHISEFWMPAFIGAFAFPLLSFLGWLMTRMPQPTQADKELRTERVALDSKARLSLFKNFMPVLVMLFFANLFVTVLQDIKEDFLVKILDVDAAGLSSWAFAKVDATVTLIILCMFGLMSAVRSNIKVLCMLLGLVTCGTATLSFLAFNYSALQLQPMTWLFLQSLSLYTVYLSFQTLFFERFIACFKIKGNVGFFIITLDFIGYTGTVVVLIFKEFFNPAVNWLDFYNLMSGYVGIACSVAFIGSAVYLIQRYRREKYAEVSGEELDTPHPAGGLSGKRVALELLPDMAK